MENQLSSLAFVVISFGFIYSETKRFNNLLTPLTVTAFPLVLITLITNFLFVYFGVNPVTARVNYFLLLCLFFMWGTGYVVNKFSATPVHISTSKPLLDLKELERYRFIISIIGVAVVGLIFMKVISLVNAGGGWWYLGSNDFEDKMVVGPAAHLSAVAQALFVLLYFISYKADRKYITYTALFILAVGIFIFLKKYRLLWLIMTVFFFNNLNNDKKTQFKKILKIGLILSLIFLTYFIFLSIFWGTFSFTNSNIWIYFYRMFLSYLITGPIVLDYWMDIPEIKPDWTLLLVPMNIINVISGSTNRIGLVNLVSNGFYNVGPGIESNIGTSFGVYYLIGGIPFSIVMAIFFSIISYYFYIKALNQGNVLYVFFALLFLAINTLNFFGQYFTSITIIEFPVIFLFILFVLKMLNKTKNIKSF